MRQSHDKHQTSDEDETSYMSQAGKNSKTLSKDVSSNHVIVLEKKNVNFEIKDHNIVIDPFLANAIVKQTQTTRQNTSSKLMTQS